MSIEINDHQDHRNVTIPAGATIKITINENVVYSRTITAGKKANVAFQLQEVNA